MGHKSGPEMSEVKIVYACLMLQFFTNWLLLLCFIFFLSNVCNPDLTEWYQMEKEANPKED